MQEKRMKANRLIKGTECAWCGAVIEFGEDVALCDLCEGVHHAGCWDGKRGCAAQSCENAPLKELEPTPPKKKLRPNQMACQHCGRSIRKASAYCKFCKKATTADGVYRGPKTPAKGATSSLVYGILGLLVCGIILGPLAIVRANAAKQAIRGNPTLSGEGLATAGLVLGIVALVVWALVFVGRVLMTQ